MIAALMVLVGTAQSGADVFVASTRAGAGVFAAAAATFLGAAGSFVTG